MDFVHFHLKGLEKVSKLAIPYISTFVQIRDGLCTRKRISLKELDFLSQFNKHFLHFFVEKKCHKDVEKSCHKKTDMQIEGMFFKNLGFHFLLLFYSVETQKDVYHAKN